MARMFLRWKVGRGSRVGICLLIFIIAVVTIMEFNWFGDRFMIPNSKISNQKRHTAFFKHPWATASYSLMKNSRKTASYFIHQTSPGLTGGFSQADVDHFAKMIDLRYTVIANGPEDSVHRDFVYEAEVTLTNNGNTEFPGLGWQIFFNQLLTLEPEHYPYNDGLEKKQYGVILYHWNGHLYSIAPTLDFGSIPPSQSKSIRIFTTCCNLAVTDTFPNWYIVFPGFKPRTIASTSGDPFKFAYRIHSPKTWRKYNYEKVNPPLPEDRFYSFSVDDLGRAPIPVLPTPLVISTYKPLSTINVRQEPWVVVTDTLLWGEGNMLSEIWNLRHLKDIPSEYFIRFIEEDIKVQFKGQAVIIEESYYLSVNPASKTIIIKASGKAGGFNAMQTLLSLADKDGNIPETIILDGPRFRYRGFMLDIARNFQDKNTIKRYLDLMAMYKLNKFHLHLTDDEGWRLEIPGLVELTKIGAQRCHDLTEKKCIIPALGSGPYHKNVGSGYLTQDDYRDILHHAKARHIEVIPEIDLPGHAHAAIKAMEARFMKYYKTNMTEATKYLLSDLKDQSVYKSVQGYKDGVVNPCLQSTYTFIRKVMETIYNLHHDIQTLKIFHFGGDEVPKNTWTQSPICNGLNLTGVMDKRKAIKEIFITQVSDMAAEFNLDVGAWEDGVMDDNERSVSKDLFPRNVYAYAWNNLWQLRQTKRAYVLANNGYKVVLTPATNTYFDHPYEPDPNEPGLIWARRYLQSKQIYGIIPANLYISSDTTADGSPSDMCDDVQACPKLNKKDNLEGIEAVLFGELLRSQNITDYMILPRLLALAERAWHEASWENEKNNEARMKAMNADWTDFANSVGYREFARLDHLGYNYRIPPPGAIIINSTLKTSLGYPGLVIEMSRDGGQTWSTVWSGVTKVELNEDIRLRTKAPSVKRYSRVVSVSNRIGVKSD
ncbi:unnamed protein product [Lymnaea stagnalis]|uniref:beta-N-acetylhexosaminidase n=1 Tax=Lymnaea stagnalis TaxID=6523 RepID=A0AAV2HU62_LYMST